MVGLGGREIGCGLGMVDFKDMGGQVVAEPRNREQVTLGRPR